MIDLTIKCGSRCILYSVLAVVALVLVPQVSVGAMPASAVLAAVGVAAMVLIDDEECCEECASAA
ncbi:hypothetical protein [Halovenus sp. HT40]|uniref:hypothetical protein n=1 Tax=Halovenus sp. HT40 TaxID=3126691 RepID=UPI00300F1A26